MSLLEALNLEAIIGRRVTTQEIWLANQSDVKEWFLTLDLLALKGISFDGGGGSSTTIFKEVVARGNTFRRPVGSNALGSEIGLSFKNCTSVIAENNVADVGTSPNNALRYDVCGSIKAFNTRKPDGTFVPGFYITGATHIPEITTDVEDALLAI